MTAKPIKSGNKVFALCCTFSTIILPFKVYIGMEDNLDGSTIGVCNDLVDNDGLTNAQGWVLYMDDYHISVRLSNLMYEKYGCTIVGTILPVDKKSR